MLSAADTVALVLALAGPPAVALVSARLDRAEEGLGAKLVGQACLAGLAAVTVWWVMGPLGLSPAALGLHTPGPSTLLYGAGMTAFFVFALGPVLLRLPRWLGFGGFERTLAQLAKLPVWYLCLAVVVGGVVEELLYRGVALAILADAGVASALAAIIVVCAFSLAHWPMWGPGPAMTTVISGACLTAFFLWHRDLVANMIAHIGTDFVGIVLGPMMARVKRRG